MEQGRIKQDILFCHVTNHVVSCPVMLTPLEAQKRTNLRHVRNTYCTIVTFWCFIRYDGLFIANTRA